MIYDVISPTVIIMPLIGFVLLGIAGVIIIALVIYLILKKRKWFFRLFQIYY